MYIIMIWPWMRSGQDAREYDDMDERDIRMSVNDGLGIAIALLKTVNIAIGNMEYFGDDGQGIAITLDLIATKLGECRSLLDHLNKDQKDI